MLRLVHRRVRAWQESGVWYRLHADFLQLLRQAGKPDTAFAVIDSV